VEFGVILTWKINVEKNIYIYIYLHELLSAMVEVSAVLGDTKWGKPLDSCDSEPRG